MIILPSKAKALRKQKLFISRVFRGYENSLLFLLEGVASHSAFGRSEARGKRLRFPHQKNFFFIFSSDKKMTQNITQTGLEIISQNFPKELTGKRIGLLCHSASITSTYEHCVDVFMRMPCKLSALFGPQHGMYGQTQDNMIEWQGFLHPVLNIPVYSLYGETRRPKKEWLDKLDALVIDMQDVGARPYTYIWTVKHCMEACSEAGVALWILDRPNPVAALPFDGPMLKDEYFSFVGGAPIPLCHKMTMGEMATLLQKLYVPSVNLHVVWMNGWHRDSLMSETGLPWVLPSPNMPCLETAIVYPGMVLLEATDMSEGRGTTRPFEIIGAPYFNTDAVISELAKFNLQGIVIRKHDFIPTFQKWQGTYCRGIQVHVTDPRHFEPVFTTAAILWAVIKTSGGKFTFKKPPYEYDAVHMPFDILAGDETLRCVLANSGDLLALREQWETSHKSFMPVFDSVAHYTEARA